MTASDGNRGRSGRHRQSAHIWNQLTVRQDAVEAGVSGAATYSARRWARRVSCRGRPRRRPRTGPIPRTRHRPRTRHLRAYPVQGADAAVAVDASRSADSTMSESAGMFPHPASPSYSDAPSTVPLGTAVPGQSAGPSHHSVPEHPVGFTHSTVPSAVPLSTPVPSGSAVFSDSGASEPVSSGAGVMVPQLCEGLELLGEYQGSGSVVRKFLLRRGMGRSFRCRSFCIWWPGLWMVRGTRRRFRIG